MQGLFEKWLEIEKKRYTQSDAIKKLNKACGTHYTNSFPSKMKGRNYSLERIPTEVRRYMMSIVLPELLPNKTEKEYEQLIINLS